jgi:hypothetical protein
MISAVDVELIPAQPAEVQAAIAAAMAADRSAEPDPWWQAGIDEALDT